MKAGEKRWNDARRAKKNGQKASRTEKILLWSHNGSMYDTLFLLRQVLLMGITPNVAMRGGRIYSMTVGNIISLDSCLMTQMPLSAFGKAFDIEQSKGVYPFKLLTVENYDLRMPNLPPLADYEPGRLKPEARVKLEQWHKDNKHEPFSVHDDLVRYCQLDCVVLEHGMRAFAMVMLENCGMNPLNGDALSIAGFSLNTYTTKYMQPGTISIFPEAGLRKNDRQSTSAQRFFEYLNATQFADSCYEISHKGNSRAELTIPNPDSLRNFKVDGHLVLKPNAPKNTPPPPPTLYEYHGCVMHASHEGCTRPARFKLWPNKTVSDEEQRAREEKRLVQLRRHGKVEIFYECQVEAMMKKDPKMKRWIEQCSIQLPMRTRDCLHGGRTSAGKLYHKVEGDEWLLFEDVTSLYVSYFLLKIVQVPFE
jgi:hypothetical protein